MLKSFLSVATMSCLISLLLSSCTTPLHVAFERVEVGHEKADVLELVGSPNRTRRWKGVDEWTYIFYSGHQIVEKEVKFEDGKVVAVQNAKGQHSLEQQLLKAKTMQEYESKVRSSRPSADEGFQDLNGEDEPSEEQK
ncbi:MAG: hypothetical protein H6624_17950 [Bdellovibrionaceae bacterium]|nr:hypothetical protein [Bdellovibrionales bacterium]MCB9086229.1 hypothetical protein [Pseudobdellovibrionaceae bacterium]